MQELNVRQRRFVAEYLKDLNGAQAAIRAGYSPASAKHSACRLLKLPDVRAAVQEAMRLRAEQTGITQAQVVRALAAIAFADTADYQDVQGDALALRDSAQIGQEQRRAIQCYKQGKFGPEIQLCDKMRALELLGKHLGMFEKQTETEDAAVRVEFGSAEAFSV